MLAGQTKPRAIAAENTRHQGLCHVMVFIRHVPSAYPPLLRQLAAVPFCLQYVQAALGGNSQTVLPVPESRAFELRNRNAGIQISDSPSALALGEVWQVDLP